MAEDNAFAVRPWLQFTPVRRCPNLAKVQVASCEMTWTDVYVLVGGVL